jgi:tripartite-type tricarboxylate transporter receptor subunit TctC
VPSSAAKTQTASPLQPFSARKTGGVAMLPARFAAGMILAASVASATGPAHGQGLLDRPIRIVTAEPGAGADLVARLLAPGLTAGLGRQVIVENRGGSVMIPAGIVARASADGHTLILYPGTFWIAPLMQKVNYHPTQDFAPVSLATTAPVVVVVHPSVAAKSVRELVALARDKPGQLNYGSGAAGSSTHLAAEMFNFMAGTRIVNVPYKGAGPAMIALIGEQVQVMFASGGAATPHVKSGRIRALAVTTPRPSALFPGVPTVSDSGVPGYEFSQILGLFAPAGTPSRILALLSQEVTRTLERPEVKEKLLAGGVEPVGGSPDQLAQAVRSEMARIGKVITAAGIRIQE